MMSHTAWSRASRHGIRRRSSSRAVSGSSPRIGPLRRLLRAFALRRRGGGTGSTLLALSLAALFCGLVAGGCASHHPAPAVERSAGSPNDPGAGANAAGLADVLDRRLSGMADQDQQRAARAMRATSTPPAKPPPETPLRPPRRRR